MPTTSTPSVPDRYHGVWQRTLLETPTGRDTTTWVRWLQTGLWHGDLRVPATADRNTVAGRAELEGFGGTTLITRPDPAQPEVCTWEREIDLQPPRSTPDAGHMVFDSIDRLHETGIHGKYFEVWERLPGSLGRRIALAALDESDAPTTERLLVAGRYLMHLRPRSADWPADTARDDTLAEVVARHRHKAEALLDVGFSFGTLAHGQWTIERSTLPALEGTVQACALIRHSEHTALVHSERLTQRWQVLEWQQGRAAV